MKYDKTINVTKKEINLIAKIKAKEEVYTWRILNEEKDNFEIQSVSHVKEPMRIEVGSVLRGGFS